MADNVGVTAGAATYTAAADEVTYSGDTSKVQLVRLVHVSGTEGSKTLTEIVGTAGSPGTAVVTIQGVGSGTAVPVSIASVPSHAVTSAVVSALHVVAAASANATNVKASAGTLRGFSFYNNAAYPVYLKFHNTAGTPTAGAGVVRTFAIQAGTQRDCTIPGGGLSFGTGIGITLVQDLADAGTTAVAASDAVGEIFYE